MRPLYQSLMNHVFLKATQTQSKAKKGIKRARRKGTTLASVTHGGIVTQRSQSHHRKLMLHRDSGCEKRKPLRQRLGDDDYITRD
jgi:hypothetical protein